MMKNGLQLFLFILACLTSPAYSVNHIHDTYSQWVEKHEYPYSASNERKEKILSNYPRLKVGLSKAQVANLIGTPDFSQAMASKGPRQVYIGSSWTYYFQKPESAIVNLENDIGVQIFFDTSGKTKWIVPSNIEGMSEIGSPSRNNI